MNYFFRNILATLAILFVITLAAEKAQAQQSPQGISLPKLSVSVDDTNEKSDIVLTLQILGVITILSLAPSILIMMTCFTRIIVVFSFLKQALGTHSQPP